MFEFFISWLILTVAVWIAAAILPGVHVRSLGAAVLVAAVFGILNVVIGWFLFFIIGLGTLGLGFLLAFITRWVVDAILLKLVSSMTDRFRVDSFSWAFVAALVMAAVGTMGEWLIH